MRSLRLEYSGAMAGMKVGKATALVVSMVLGASCLAGCGAQETNSAGGNDESRDSSELTFPEEFATSELGPNAFPAERGEHWQSPYSVSEESVLEKVPLENNVEGKEVNEDGVLIVNWPDHDGPVYHPVNTVMYGLYSYSGYQLTGNQEYLRRAEANARALVNGAEEVDGALWFPYPFDYAMNGDETMTLEVPWYSGMAQGQALDLFSKLCAETDDDYWCEQADKTFKSFLQTDLPDQSFARVDDQGHLWLEEYVGSVPPTQVVNGHIYSTFGLVEYVRLTGNALAAELANGAATTLVQDFDDFRVPDGISYYCAAQYCKDVGWQPENYHRGVGGQLVMLRYLMDMPELGDMSRQLRDDHS